MLQAGVFSGGGGGFSGTSGTSAALTVTGFKLASFFLKEASSSAGQRGVSALLKLFSFHYFDASIKHKQEHRFHNKEPGSGCRLEEPNVGSSSNGTL